MHPFINGLIFGLIFLFILGPAFFALIQTSIQQGFKKAIFLALGVSVSDIIYVIIVLFGLSTSFENDNVKFWMAVGGTGILMGYAIYSWFRKPKIFNEEHDQESKYGRNLLKGMLLNGLNTFIIVFWATWVSNVTVRFQYDFNEQVQFFGAMLITILSLDVGKAFIAHRLKHLITVKFIRRMNQSIAIILVIFSFQLIYFLYQNYA